MHQAVFETTLREARKPQTDPIRPRGESGAEPEPRQAAAPPAHEAAAEFASNAIMTSFH